MRFHPLHIFLNFLCGVVLDVKWNHLICKDSQLRARNICVRAAVVR
jgi:hypothetical protein